MTRLDSQRGDSSHRYPVFLGDGRHFLVFVQGPTEGGNVLLGSLDSNETKLVATADGGLAFAAPDIVLMVRDRVLRAQRMNMKTFAWEGDPVAIAENIQISNTFNYANISASQTGVLTYVNGISSTMSELAFLDATGKRLSSVGPPADQLDPRISPDGSTVLVAQNLGSASTSDIWAYDLRRNIATRLTFSAANDFAPVWSPDGKSMVYTSFEHSPGDLFIKRIDANGAGHSGASHIVRESARCGRLPPTLDPAGADRSQRIHR